MSTNNVHNTQIISFFRQTIRLLQNKLLLTDLELQKIQRSLSQRKAKVVTDKMSEQ